MKKVTNNNIVQKIAITILIVLSFNFITPTFSRADFGGVLLGPVVDLVAGLGDALMALLQTFMYGNVEINLDGGELNPVEKLSTAFMINADDYVKALKSDEGKEKLRKLGLYEDEITGTVKEVNESSLDHGWFGMGSYSIPVVKYSPDMIFSNQVPALDANFISPKKWDNNEQNNKSIALQLQETISAWYRSLRNLVVVCLLAVLLYVAIRIIVTSVAADKAKYKQMLMDWLIALCLLFFLHYIMSFTMTLVEIITSSLADSSSVTVKMIPENTEDSTEVYFKTNLTGYCRLMIEHVDLGTKAIFLFFYIGIIVYTFKFTFEYMKRAITLAFLTLMAPLVTLTYPIDKMGDGKAQAFNAWFKEFAYNAILQPFHLIIYSIFMGAGMNIAVENPLYAIFFMAFLTPAEKLLRKFFGFDKAPSAGASFAGGFGGAAAFNALKGVASKGVNALSHGNGNSGGNSGKNNNIRQKNQIKDPNAPKGLEAFKNGQGNPQLREAKNGNSGNNNRQSDRDEVMDRYSSEGFGQNANGEYFNPYTNEYDASYDPHKDSLYNNGQNNRDEIMDKYSSEGFGQNANGEYFNPYTNEYDASYDPHKDSLYSQQSYSMQSSVPSTSSQSDSEQSGKKPKEWKQDENWGLGKWANENLVKPAAQRVGTGIKNVAGKASDKFRESGAYTRVIKPGMKKARDMAKAINNSKAGRIVGRASDKLDAAKKKMDDIGLTRSLKNSARGALNVGKKAVVGGAKIAGKGLAAATGAAVGIGMGIAGDNLEDVIHYGLAGAAVGYAAIPAIGKGAVNGMTKLGNNIRNTYEEGAFGKTQAALNQQTRDILNDKELRAEEEELMRLENDGIRPTPKELNDRMHQIADYNNAGVTDISTIHKSIEVEDQISKELEISNQEMSEKERSERARKQAKTIAQIANDYSAKDLRDEKKVNQLQSDIVNQLTSGKTGLDSEKAKASADNIIGKIKQIKGVGK